MNDFEYFCTLDTALATKDYLQGGRCARFLGVRKAEFNPQAIERGVTTFTVDVDYWEFCKAKFGLSDFRQISSAHHDLLTSIDDDLNSNQKWYRVKLEQGKRPAERSSYVYPTFSIDQPQFLRLVELEELRGGPTIPAPQQSSTSRNTRGQGVGQFVFDAFHVGQGMCSVVHDGMNGILIDAGAGAPVTRSAYLGKRISNQLVPLLDQLSQVQCVISHADADHWRLLAWDDRILSKLVSIWVPNGVASLAFRDNALVGKVIGSGDMVLPLDQLSDLNVFRSDPLHSDRNGECLVALFTKGMHKVLAPGDYVYARMRKDNNPAIVALKSVKYKGVIVPHHGDIASSSKPFRPQTPATAFFSAGTHKGFGHPTDQSLNAHSTKGFKNINRNTHVDISPQRLC